MLALQRRITGAEGARALLLAASAGAAMALGQVPVSWPLATLAALPVLSWLFLAAEGWRDAFRIGWLAGAGYFAATLFWIVEPFRIDAERHGWMAPFALVLLAGGLALFWAVPFALARRMARPGSALLALAALWTLSEMARAYVLTGFPWALLAYVWVDTPVMQVVALTGPHLLGLLTLLAGFLLATLRPLPGALALALLAAGWGWGAATLARPVAERDPALTVRIVQPNAAQQAKWDPALQETFYRRLVALTAAPGDPAPDVTIWPETAVPYVLGFSGDLLAEVAAAPPGDGLVMLGIRRLEIPEAGREDWYNALAVLRPDGTPWAVYDKHHLVPFGEYVPFGETLGRLGGPGLATLTRQGFRAGPGPRALSVPGLPPFLPLICYEAIFPQGMAAPEGRVEWLVQVTNDAWFGRLAGPQQHLAQARVRAIEQGLPLARAANTGISAMIDPRGRVLERLGLGETGAIDAALPAALPAPPYARWGDLPGLATVLLIFGLTFTNVLGGLFLGANR